MIRKIVTSDTKYRMAMSFLLELVANSAMIFRFKSTEIEQFLSTKEVLAEKVAPHSLHKNRVFLSFKIVLRDWIGSN